MLDKDKFFSLISKGILIFAVFLIGLLAGRLYEKLSTESSLALECPSCSDAYCILDIQEITPLYLKGEVTAGDVRVVAGSEVVSGKDFKFTLPTTDLYKGIKFAVPGGAKFFASKRGKKMYPVSDEKALERISPENIIFFKTLDEAKRYGLVQ